MNTSTPLIRFKSDTMLNINIQNCVCMFSRYQLYANDVSVLFIVFDNDLFLKVSMKRKDEKQLFKLLNSINLRLVHVFRLVCYNTIS